MSPSVIGVDGCPAGWVAAYLKGSTLSFRLFSKFSEILEYSERAEIIAVDMPIGLPVNHGRSAERLARSILGARRSSVFSTPSRAAFRALAWQEACEINLKNSVPPRRLSMQSFTLFPKIREIDKLLDLNPAHQLLVREVHPEVSFCEMNGRKPLTFAKKKKQGELERLELLSRAGIPPINFDLFDSSKKDVARDDIIDACAAAWSARRILDGNARHFPETEERDARGLLMRIHA